MHGTDAATAPPGRTQPEHGPEATEPHRPERRPPPPLRPRRRASPALEAIAFHAGAIVLFAIPAVVLWWHVWSTHPSATLTCPCGDPAQQVWFTAWPAYALAHGHNLVFSHWVNVPHGANLLSNTSGTLVGALLAPVTWTSGPITATNVALTLAPALSAWGCFVALRPLIKWKVAAFPAALVYGYSAAIVTVADLRPRIGDRARHPADPLHPPARDPRPPGALGLPRRHLPGGPPRPPVLHLARRSSSSALFSASSASCPVLVRGLAPAPGPVLARPAGPHPRCGLGRRPPGLPDLVRPGRTRGRDRHALRHRADRGCAAGRPALPGQLLRYGQQLHTLRRLPRAHRPSPDFIGAGGAAAGVAAFILAWRRPLTWLVLLLAASALWLSLGAAQLGVTPWLSHLWLPWRDLYNLAILKEILPDQIMPFVSLFLAFLLALGLDALFTMPVHGWFDRHRRAVTLAATAVVGVAALLPLFLTFDMPLTVRTVRLPSYFTTVTPTLPANTVLLTIPFAVSGEAQPMLWQAVDRFDFRLAGAALKTPNANGGPVQQGVPGSARSILTNLTAPGGHLPTGAATELLTVRHALVQWHVQRVVITGNSLDPVYSSGFFTEALGVGPVFDHGAWVWTLRPGWTSVRPAYGAGLEACRAAAGAPAVKGKPLFMSTCVLFDAGGTEPGSSPP